MELGNGVAIIGQWTNKPQGLLVVASAMRLDRILERASGHGHQSTAPARWR